MIKNGRPYTIENGSHDCDLITDLPDIDMKIVFSWIQNNIIPVKTVNLCSSSYWLKHVLQHDTGIYVTNNQFKDAMLMCGFPPVDDRDLNWIYRISKKSPVYKNRDNVKQTKEQRTGQI